MALNQLKNVIKTRVLIKVKKKLPNMIKSLCNFKGVTYGYQILHQTLN